MPDYSSKTVGEMRSLLAAQNGVALVGEFHQDTFRTRIAMDVTRKPNGGASWSVAQSVTITKNAGTPQETEETHAFDGGYCNGVVTDWIRRMLLSGAGNAPTGDKATYQYAAIKNELPTIYGNDSAQTIDQKLVFSDEARGLDAARRRAERSANRMGSAWYKMNQLDWYGPPNENQTVRPEDWQNAAQTLDAEMLQSRQADGRLGNARTHNKDKVAPRKKFADMVLKSSGSRTYPTAGHWAAALDDVIPASSAAKLGFSRPSASGHAVAVWRRGEPKETNDAYWVLDPNLGVFSATHGGMMMILQILFWLENGHTPFYDTCASLNGTRVNYMVWGRA